MNADEFRRRLDDWWLENWEGRHDAISNLQLIALRDIITDAWYDGHKRGIKDMREAWESHLIEKEERLMAKAGETA